MHVPTATRKGCCSPVRRKHLPCLPFTFLKDVFSLINISRILYLSVLWLFRKWRALQAENKRLHRDPKYEVLKLKSATPSYLNWLAAILVPLRYLILARLTNIAVRQKPVTAGTMYIVCSS